MEEFFYLISCTPVNELLFLFDLKKDVDYIIENNNGFNVNKIILNNEKTKVLKEVIQDVNIFIPKVNKYLSEYIFAKEIPTDAIVAYLNLFTSDDLFLPYVSRQRMIRAEIKHCNAYDKKH